MKDADEQIVLLMKKVINYDISIDEFCVEFNTIELSDLQDEELIDLKFMFDIIDNSDSFEDTITVIEFLNEIHKKYIQFYKEGKYKDIIDHMTGFEFL